MVEMESIPLNSYLYIGIDFMNELNNDYYLAVKQESESTE
jgi:hypothetical protein